MNLEPFQLREHPSHGFVWISVESRPPNTNETPASALEDSLASHVLRDLVHSMKSIATTLDCGLIGAVRDNDIDAILANPYLRCCSVSGSDKPLEHLALEW